MHYLSWNCKHNQIQAVTKINLHISQKPPFLNKWFILRKLDSVELDLLSEQYIILCSRTIRLRCPFLDDKMYNLYSDVFYIHTQTNTTKNSYVCLYTLGKVLMWSISDEQIHTHLKFSKNWYKYAACKWTMHTTYVLLA